MEVSALWVTMSLRITIPPVDVVLHGRLADALPTDVEEAKVAPAPPRQGITVPKVDGGLLIGYPLKSDKMSSWTFGSKSHHQSWIIQTDKLGQPFYFLICLFV